MGKSYTPTYRAEYKDQTGKWNMIHWNSTKRPGVSTPHGKPTNENAEKLRQALNRSFAPGGVNEHVSKGAGFVVHVTEIVVVRQRDGNVMARACAPMFEAA